MAQKWRPVTSPFDLIERWGQVVDSVQEGYDDNIYEYMNDLSVRDLLERLLHDADLGRFEQMEWVRAHVAEIDERFAGLLLPAPARTGKPWWRARPPAYGGPEFAADVAGFYGVTIEER